MSKSEKQKMIDGENYYSSDSELVADRLRATDLCHRFNHELPSRQQVRRELIHELLPNADKQAEFAGPFFCAYGYNIKIGQPFYANTDLTILDIAPVTIGNNVMLAPHVQLYTAAHPTNPEQRATGIECGKPITIGNNVWIGGGVIVCPGVTIGEGSVIGAGSVVTKDIPPRVVAAGNPCRVIRSVDES
ncbi:sugar O-acetyltransferase [Buttiauxella sp. B2]|uniref:sugar O-acetyltransferase n=1 Tax=Buttiauxella sp. B2 TaxID=2587812 RepID=UPI001121945D|nr:sugar O-acetyltransferase [Buttiauxella sp. B2]TNV16828.1 sugar O-acetyltransferase [Buttiauxella sp. B2]